MQIGNLATYPHRTNGGFPSNIGVRCRHEVFNFSEKIPGHFDGGDVAECAQGETDNILVGVAQVTGLVISISSLKTV